jgi:hypothetical protein
MLQVDDEMDELVLMDEDAMDLPPEDLPRHVLSDFAVYNSEGFCSSLELLPMWSGVDPDIVLYASGNVLDDDGEWAGGQALNAGKSTLCSQLCSGAILHSTLQPQVHDVKMSTEAASNVMDCCASSYAVLIILQ